MSDNHGDGDVKIFVTLGSGNEFGISDSGLFIRQTKNPYYEDQVTIDLGPATEENFQRLIDNMIKLEIHMA